MKTRSFIALASFAGLAHAETAINAHNHDTARLGFTLVLDVSDYQFWDEQGSVYNERLDTFIEAYAQVTNISWDINLTTITAPDATFPSWAQEATMTFNGTEDVSVSADAFGVVNQNYAGNQASGLTLAADDILSLEFWESFDDAPMLADSRLNEGSTLTIQGFLPTPNVCASFLICGLMSTRRRRNK